MRALQTRSQEVRVAWSVPLESVATAVVAAPDGVIVGTSDGRIRHIVEGQTRDVGWMDGQVRWLARADDGTVYAGGDLQNWAAFRPDGTRAFYRLEGHRPFAAPLIGDDGTLVYGSGRLLVAADAATGEEKWSRAEWMWLNSDTPLPLRGDGLLVRTSNGLQALESDGAPRWTMPGNPSAPCVGHDGTVFVGEGYPPTRLRALDPGIGAVRWEKDLRQKILGTPAQGPDGTLYVALTEGHVVALSPDDGEVRWRAPVYTDTPTVLTHDGGSSLLVGNSAIHQVWCIDTTIGERAWSHRAERPHVGAAPADGGFIAVDSGQVVSLENAGWRVPSSEASDPRVERAPDFVIIDGVRIPVRR
ncbi:MAG: hypothetical protein FJX76_02875 [Armatimonadetes bacterium]|nr:hypothetical protein [Armatimonadota bacterium]